MKAYLGIELGSTRIKAVSISKSFEPLSAGSYQWKSRLQSGIWTYDLDEVWTGLKAALSGIENKDDVCVTGVSAMMHGYLAFDKDWNLLVPFRTWQNTITGRAADELTKLFGFNIPQRWSIAHLYQAVLNGEEHLSHIAHITTLAGYVHHCLTGENVLGVGDASGMFPIDSHTGKYDERMLSLFDDLVAPYGFDWKLRELLPEICMAGENAGTLSKSGAEMLDGLLPEGMMFAPPEGDAGTGMTATHAISPRTGNVSAGTSIFSMVVLEEPLKHVYPEIDLVTTPAGDAVAMVHCNNCTSDFNAWVSVLKESAELFGAKVDESELYRKLFEKSLEGEPDCGGVTVVNYMAGEGVTHLDAGRPLVIRYPDSNFTLANFLRSQLYATMSTLKIGMEILAAENVRIDKLTGHGGLFKVPNVGQRYLAAACRAPVTVMETSGEGGPYGMALLASYCARKDKAESLEEYLDKKVFAGVKGKTAWPSEEDVQGLEAAHASFMQALSVEKEAIEHYGRNN